VVSFLDDNESDAWLVVGLQLDARLSDGGQFVVQDLSYVKEQLVSYLNGSKYDSIR